MAKAKTVQLQVDITNDEEWEKFLQREGLLVIDIYSEWCGPCLAMQGNLKKIKLEMGGDFLHLGMAKANTITSINRFTNKSEPTWMFIAQGQQVGLLFGSNAPELQRMILEEMKNEKECLEGRRTRISRHPSDLSDQEQSTFQAGVKQHQERERIKLEKQSKQTKDRCVAQAKNILDTMAHLGLIIILPHASKKGLEVLEQFIPHTGLAISKKERPLLTEDSINDIEYLSPVKMPAPIRKHLISDRSLAIMLTVDQELSPGPVDESVLRFVYGESKTPPGEADTPGFELLRSQIAKRQKEELDAAMAKEAAETEDQPGDAEALGGEEEEVMDEGVGEEMLEEEQEIDDGAPGDFPLNIVPTMSMFMVDDDEPPVEEEVDEEDVIDDEQYDLWGIWAPATDLVKATALMYCFPLITSALILPKEEPSPPHLAIAFDAFKKNDVFKLMDEYSNEVMAYGFFSSDEPDEAKLIAKTRKVYEKRITLGNFGEKLILKVAKKKSDPVLAFAQLGPTYMSSNVDNGEKDCSFFFPENYEEEEQEVVPSAIQLNIDDEAVEGIGDYQDMVFEAVVHGETDEDLADLGEVEEIPPVRMSELPQVEAEEEAEEQEEPPPVITPSRMRTRSRASRLAMKTEEPPPPPPIEEVAPPPEGGEAPPPEEGEAPPAGEEGAPAAEEAAPPAAEAAEEAAPPTEEPPPAEAAPPAEEEEEGQ